MKILVIGDIHGEVNALCKAISFATSQGHFDLVLLTGDIGSPILGPNSGRSALSSRLYTTSVQAIWEVLSLLDIPILFVPGNRDLSSVAGNNLVNNIDILTGQAPFTHGGLHFVGVGGSNCIQGEWPYEWDEDETESSVTDALKNGSKFMPQTVLLAHDPPWATLLDRHAIGSTPIGSRAVRKLVCEFQPLLVVSGHVHESPGVDVLGDRTLAINAGSLLFEDKNSTVYPPQIVAFRVAFTQQFFRIDIGKDDIRILWFFSVLEQGERLYKRKFIFKDGKLFECSRNKRVEKPVTGSAPIPRKPKAPARGPDEQPEFDPTLMDYGEHW